MGGFPVFMLFDFDSPTTLSHDAMMTTTNEFELIEVKNVSNQFDPGEEGLPQLRSTAKDIMRNGGVLTQAEIAIPLSTAERGDFISGTYRVKRVGPQRWQLFQDGETQMPERVEGVPVFIIGIPE